MVRAGVPEHNAMAISGHKTLEIFDRYDIVDHHDRRQAMLKTQEYLGTVPTERTVAQFPTASEGGSR